MQILAFGIVSLCTAFVKDFVRIAHAQLAMICRNIDTQFALEWLHWRSCCPRSR